MVEYEQCDKCGKQLSVLNNEDFFEETEDGSFVYCEECWIKNC